MTYLATNKNQIKYSLLNKSC